MFESCRGRLLKRLKGMLRRKILKVPRLSEDEKPERAALAAAPALRLLPNTS